jgi:hypothetical protein
MTTREATTLDSGSDWIVQTGEPMTEEVGLGPSSAGTGFLVLPAANVAMAPSAPALGSPQVSLAWVPPHEARLQKRR